MRKTCVYLAMVLALTLVLAGASQAGMWVGIQGGPNFTATTDIKTTDEGGETLKGITRDPAVLGGIIIGYDFVKEGFLGYNYPDWMKYFSFCTDFTYNRATSRQQMYTEIEPGNVEKEGFLNADAQLACWSFLFKFRYGFLPDAEVPFGQLQPYIMVGPGILFSSIRGHIDDDNQGSSSSVDIALVTEAGVRWMALKNVSLDAGFRYRFAAPKYNRFSQESEEGRISVKTDLHLFTAMFRVSYHF